MQMPNTMQQPPAIKIQLPIRTLLSSHHSLLYPPAWSPLHLALPFPCMFPLLLHLNRSLIPFHPIPTTFFLDLLYL